MDLVAESFLLSVVFLLQETPMRKLLTFGCVHGLIETNIRTLRGTWLSTSVARLGSPFRCRDKLSEDDGTK